MLRFWSVCSKRLSEPASVPPVRSKRLFERAVRDRCSQKLVSVALCSEPLHSALLCSVHGYARVHTSIYIYIWWSAVWVGPCDYLVTLPIGGHKVPGHKVPGHKVTVTRLLVRASPRMSKSVVKACSIHEKTNVLCIGRLFLRRHLQLKSIRESMLNIRKIQYIMHLAVVSEEASAVREY